jgi:hypothetical protein
VSRFSAARRFPRVEAVTSALSKSLRLGASDVRGAVGRQRRHRRHQLLGIFV